MAEILIAAVPLFLLLGALFLGHYPGHRTVVRIAERIASARSHSRGGRRPPPAPAAGAALVRAFRRAVDRSPHGKAATARTGSNLNR